VVADELVPDFVDTLDPALPEAVRVRMAYGALVFAGLYAEGDLAAEDLFPVPTDTVDRAILAAHLRQTQVEVAIGRVRSAIVGTMLVVGGVGLSFLVAPWWLARARVGSRQESMEADGNG